MKNPFFLLVALFWQAGWQSVAVTPPLSVSQGEQVTLTIKLINVGNTELRHISVQLDPQTTPSWIQSEAKTHRAVDVPRWNRALRPDSSGSRFARDFTRPAKSDMADERPSAVVPLTFTVNRDAPEEAEVSLHLVIGDEQGNVWTQMVPLKVLPRPKPKDSQLLQNFPNPFNPETWIPYQLDRPAPVRIQIYESSGRLVRTLDLGHQRAGFYTSRTEAAHWDGRNETGERVSSGVYFYHLETNHFSAMRKMLIIK
ncbi:T9SS type A sorting domain-containing protein [Candidatus Poribacteria bacterium]|nr:T9SS type A sorting domain-containing protein [Candidatus Poribacteria bacterium]